MKSPEIRAFLAEADLPSEDAGPVDLVALMRLASIWDCVDI